MNRTRSIYRLQLAAYRNRLRPSGQAQTAPAPDATATSAPSATKPSDEVVTLQAFSVVGDAAHGYVASESTTGTRVAAKIQDLPFSVNVVTADSGGTDMGLFTLTDQLSNARRFSPSEVTGQYQLRGFLFRNAGRRILAAWA